MLNSYAAAWANFNPRPSCEGRPVAAAAIVITLNFNPRPSCEGRHDQAMAMAGMAGFQSTSLLRGTTRAVTDI